MKKKLAFALIGLICLIVCLGGIAIASGKVEITLAGGDEIEVYNLATPTKRIDTVYKQGDDKVFIQCSDALLIPIGEGNSMSPMVTKGHLVLVTTNFEFSDIQVGDFIVVDGLAGRYFHQVVEIMEKSFTTRGISNTENDIFPVFEEDIVGVAIAIIW